MTATRRSRGTTSRKSSSRLLSVSVCWTDRPVTLAPGRARLVSGAKRIVPQDKDDGDDRCRLLHCRGRAVIRDNDVDVAIDELGCDLVDAFGAPLRPTILDRKGAALDPAELVHPRRKSGRP